MLIQIGEQKYSITDGLAHPTLNDIFYLKVKTRSEEFPEGVSIPRLSQMLEVLQKAETGADIMDSVDGMMGLRAVIFLARRHAGEHISVEEANDVALADLHFIKEEGDDEIIREARKRRGPFWGRRTRKQ
jgi:hypothetical protein